MALGPLQLVVIGFDNPALFKALADEGVPIAPLPFPVAPPDKLN